MSDFLSNIFSFPTLFYTGLLGLTILYWLVSSLGLANFDIADGMELEGAEIADGSGWMNKFKLDGIPITISISFIILFAWVICFIVVHFYQGKISNNLIEAFLGIWAIILAPIVAAPVVGTLLTPLKPIFKKLKDGGEGRTAHSLIGHLATVRTNKITSSFGEVEINDAGPKLILHVRSDEPNNYILGESVVISEYVAEDNTYRIRSRK